MFLGRGRLLKHVPTVAVLLAKFGRCRSNGMAAHVEVPKIGALRVPGPKVGRRDGSIKNFPLPFGSACKI